MTGGAGLVATTFADRTPPGVELHRTWHTTPLATSGHHVDHRIDLRDPSATRRLVESVRPDVVVHTAYDKDAAEGIVGTTRSIAAGCAQSGASLIHLSTDAVFGGDAAPYQEHDEPGPVNDYGRWKLQAERVAVELVPDVCTTRTSLVVRRDPPDRSSAEVLRSAAAGEPTTWFTDELRQPILVDDLAEELWALVVLDRTDRAGVWHLPGPEVLSRHALALRVATASGLDVSSLRSGTLADHPDPRPADLTMVGRRRTALSHPPRPV